MVYELLTQLCDFCVITASVRFEFDEMETFLEDECGTFCGSYQRRVRSVCMATLTPPPAPVHYFLMSNHHLTAALSMHARQLIAHGKSAATSKTIRHLKYFRRNADPGSVLSASAAVRHVQLQDIHH